MKRALLLGTIWLAATAVSGAAAWGAVRLAGEQTAEQALRPMSVRQVEALAGTVPTSGATSTAPSSTTRPAASTTSAPTTTAPPSTTTTSPEAATTTEAAALGAQRTAGGTVVVGLQSGGVTLVTATPAPGYTVEVKDAGPGEVVVVFERGDEAEIRVQAALVGGMIVFEVDSEGAEAAEGGEDDG